jgi:hypothetical protein
MNDEQTAIQTTNHTGGGALTLKQIADRVNLVHEVLNKVMQKGTHYGTVPGCGAKMVLLKPGADVLAMTFQLVPQFRVERTDLSGEHREYDVTCSMYSAAGVLVGQGVGSASTMEKKYRYRKGERGEKIENEDIADVYNTVLKIAKKRAHIDATLTVTGAADLFTQDLIDEDAEPGKPPVAMPTPRNDRHEDQFPANVATGLVSEVVVGATSKPGAAKEWQRFDITVDGMKASTFSESIANDAASYRDTGATVNMEWKDDGKGHQNVVSISAV